MASDAERTDSRQPPASPPQARTVSFEGMAAGTCTDDVREVATYFGEIELLHTDRRGHGIVRFAQASAAQEFYDTLHGMGRQAGLVPDPVAPACTPPCGTEAGSTEPDAASPSASSPRMAQPVGSASHYSNGQSAGCGELAGGGAVAEAWASRDPARMPPSATVHIYNTSSAATHNDIHSRLSKYGTIHDIRKLPRRSGFLVDFLVPASAADCIANYHLKNRDLARWATPAALRQAPAPRSQWRRPHEDATTATTTNTTTATAAATAATTTTATATTAAPAPAALQQPPAPPHKYPCQRLASDEPVPGFGEVGDMGGEALCLRRAQASVLFTGVRPFMSAHNVETILSCFGPIQDVTIVPGKAEAVVSFVAHGSAVRCLRKFQHRRHTVQHVPLALYRLCHPDSRLQEWTGLAERSDMGDAWIAPNCLPPSQNDAIAASSGAEGRRRRARSDESPEPPSTMTTHTESASDSGRPQKSADYFVGACGGPRSLPAPRVGSGGGGSGKDLRQQLRALQAQNAEWRRRAEAAEAREKILLDQLTALKSVVAGRVDRLITILAAMEADADRSGPSGRPVW